MSKRDLLGIGRQKLDPKLQMIANGDNIVNAVRAETAAGLRVTNRKLLNQTETRRGALHAAAALPDVKRLPPRGSLTELSSDVEANVFVQLANGLEDGKGVPGEVARRGNIVSARVTMRELRKLTDDPRVAFVEMGQPLKAPQPKITEGAVAAPSVSDRKFGRESQHKYGADVLIGIIDVQGFDFSHPDFLDDSGKTRWVAIWDQGGSARPCPSGDTQFGYGAEFRKEHLDAALKAAPALGVPAYEVERQSQLDEGSHGTHVASIAAGNRGICRKAAIAGVLIDLPVADTERRTSFYDSTRISDAVDYLVDLATKMQKRLAINISLGTNGHAHDGTGAIGQWLDTVLSKPGRAITVAAGNAGQEKGETPDDVGWIMGRIHTAGHVNSAGLVSDIEWVVVGNGLADISENELELWFSPQDRFNVSLQSPAGELIGPIGPREFIENRRLSDGSFVSVYNELYHPSNGANYIAIYLSPNLKSTPVVGVMAGTWRVRLEGIQIRDGRYDGWIERDDPVPIRKNGTKEFWRFPSFFSENSTVDNSTVSSLACGQRIITVANLHAARDRINISSSQGPTRDGRCKPDVAAPGTDIVAAKGFSQDDEAWIGMSGTSMASPFVCGLAGLMLAIEPKLTAAQIEGIIRSTAKPLPGGNYKWANDAGFGAIDPEACLEQAAKATTHKDRTQE